MQLESSAPVRQTAEYVPLATPLVSSTVPLCRARSAVSPVGRTSVPSTVEEVEFADTAAIADALFAAIEACERALESLGFDAESSDEEAAA